MMVMPRSRAQVTVMSESSSRTSLGRFLIGQWLPAIERTIRATTFINYQGHVRNHIVPRLGTVPLNELSGTLINSVYAELLSYGQSVTRRSLSPTTVRRIHATLHRALRDAVRWGLLLDNPADRSDPPRSRADGIVEMHTWDVAQLRRFLEVVRGDALYPVWHVLAMTGMRRGECLGMRWRDIELDEGRIAVRQCLVAVGCQVCPSPPKTARARRVIALDQSTIDALASHAAKSRDQGDRNELVFTGREGGFLHPNSVSKRFARLVAVSGLPRIRLHDLRYTHATIALRAGVHPKIVSERLGHSTVSLTLDVYSHAVPHMQKEAALQIGDTVFGAHKTTTSSLGG
jgi:integrase